MKFRLVLLMCCILILGFVSPVIATDGDSEGVDNTGGGIHLDADEDDSTGGGDEGSADGDDDDGGGDDDDDEDEEDQWGEFALEHKLNVPWDYPADYVARPFIYNRRITSFGFGFDYKYADQYYDYDGNLVDGSFQIAQQTFYFRFRTGLTDRLTIGLNFPFTYKKTRIEDGNQNYRRGMDNTYGILLEEALIDYFTQSDGWTFWEFDWPWLGDIELEVTYEVFHKWDPTTAIAIESIPKFSTGTDNIRRGETPRNYVTSGQTDWYNGVAVKQQFWKFSAALKAGYNWRLPSHTKYAPGKLDLADQLKIYAEIFFQVPEFPIIQIPLPIINNFFQSFAIGSGFKYTYRLTDSNLDPIRGEEEDLSDGEGFLLEIMPKIIYNLSGATDLVVGASIPIQGNGSFLKYTTSFYLPPYEIESYDAVGVVYSLSLTKRFQ